MTSTKRKPDSLEGAAKRPRRAVPLCAAAKKLYIQFHWDEPEVELPPDHDAIVHIFSGYVDVSFEGPKAHTLDDLVLPAEAEVRNRLESCHVPPTTHCIFRTRPGQGLIEHPTHFSV